MDTHSDDSDDPNMDEETPPWLQFEPEKHFYNYGKMIKCNPLVTDKGSPTLKQQDSIQELKIIIQTLQKVKEAIQCQGNQDN